MAVIIKLNGQYIGETTMSVSEIHNAQKAGFTILTRKEGRQYGKLAKRNNDTCKRFLP